jgi:outer membrane receptor protein involved in Fe transport
MGIEKSEDHMARHFHNWFCGSSASSAALFVAILLSSGSTTFAQTFGTTGSIRGQVTDDTNAALPGVTVTATSPALLLPQVVTTSGSDGNYSFPELPIGEYRLIFQLSGFRTLVREQIHIPVGFTATINVTIALGSVEETLTVSGASPVVDTTSTTPRTSLSSQLLAEVLPVTGTLQDYTVVAPGVVPAGAADLGGGTAGSGSYSAYGISGQFTTLMEGIDGRRINNPGISPDPNALEELSVVTWGGSAEQSAPGVVVTMVAKSGGNSFSGRYEALGQHEKFQSSNLTPELRAQGLTSGDSLLHSYQLAGDLGGRLIRDKLWFYAAFRRAFANRTALGYSESPGGDGVYGTSDDVIGTKESTDQNQTYKLTYQAARNYKLVGFFHRNGQVFPGSGGSRTRPYEATTTLLNFPKQTKIELQGVPSNRFLFNVLVGTHRYTRGAELPEEHADKPPSFDNTTLLNTGASLDLTNRPRHFLEPKGSLTFMPERKLFGSHEIKAGFLYFMQTTGNVFYANPYDNNYQLIFDTIGGLPHQPLQIVTYNYPVTPRNKLNEGGAYVQDTWRMGTRTTLNLGLRFDSYHTFLPEQTKPQGQFGGSGTFPALETGTWRELAPRFGVSVNLTNDGKTVLKATHGLYNHSPGDEFSEFYNKNSLVTTTYRWRDLNRNGDYDPGEVNLDTNGPDFLNISSPANNLLNPDLRTPATYEFSVSLERELIPNLGMKVNYIDIRQSDLFGTVNVLRPYSAYTVMLQRPDPGPDGVVGSADDRGMVTVYDYAPEFRGSNFVGNMRVNRPEDRDDRFRTIEMVLIRRMTGRWSLISNVSALKNRRWIDPIVTNPNQDYFPLDDTWNWQGKVTGNYDLPWVSVSGSYQIYSPIKGQRTNLFRAIPSSGTVTLRMEPYGDTTSGASRGLLNLRIAKEFSRTVSSRLRLSLEILNAFNAASPWSMTYASGPTFKYISSIDSPRILRGGISFSF